MVVFLYLLRSCVLLSKILISLLFDIIVTCYDIDEYRLGFRKSVFTALSTHVFKNTYSRLF